MKYKFKITKDGAESEDKEAMYYKKLLTVIYINHRHNFLVLRYKIH